jgi:hypothetical protein
MSDKQTTYATVKLDALNFTTSKFPTAKQQGIQQTNFSTIRKNADNTLGIVKWRGTEKEVPTDIAPYVVQYFPQDKLLAELETDAWISIPKIEQGKKLTASFSAAISKHRWKIAAGTASAAIGAAAAAHFLFGLI